MAHENLLRGRGSEQGITDRLRHPIYDVALTSRETVLELRDSTSADATAIASIYNHYVATTVISFEEEAVPQSAMRERIGKYSKLDCLG